MIFLLVLLTSLFCFAFNYMSNFITKFKSSEFIKHSATLVTGTVLAQLVMVVGSPVLTRLYSAEDFGQLAIIGGLLGVLLPIATLKYEQAIVVSDNDKKANELTSTSLYFPILSFLLSWPVLYLVVDFKTNPAYFFLPFVLLFNGIQILLTHLSNRYKNFSEISVSKIVQTLFNLLVGVSLGYLGFQENGLLYGVTIGFFFSALFLFIKNREKLKRVFNKENLIEFKKFPIYMLPAGFIDMMSFHIPVFSFNYFFSTEITGYYSLAMKVLLVPLSFVGNAVGAVFFQKFNEVQSNVKRKEMILKIWKTLFCVGLIPFTFLLLIGEDLFEFVFGADWGSAGVMASILAPMLLFSFISSPTSTVFLSIGLQRFNLYFSTISLIYRALCIYIGAIQADLYFGLKVLVVCEILQIIIYNIILFRKLNEDHR